MPTGLKPLLLRKSWLLEGHWTFEDRSRSRGHSPSMTCCEEHLS